MEVAVPEVENLHDPSTDGVNIHRALLQPIPRRIFVVGSIVILLLLRLYIALNPAGDLNADEAIVGLMARHILEGEHPVFYWGQTYGGTLEVYLTAAVFWITDSSTAALRTVPFALFAASAFVLWRIGKRFFGEPGATFAALLFLVWPPWLVWKSIQAHGYYGVLMLIGTLSVLVSLKIAEEPTWQRFVTLGLLWGVGWWTSPQIALLAVPILLWLAIYRTTRRWWGFASLGLGAIIGSMPWWLWNARNGWASLDQAALPETTYGARLWGLFRHVLPLGLGIEFPTTDQFVLPPWLGWTFYAFLLSAFLWFVFQALRRRSPFLTLIAGVCLVLPWIYALSPYTWWVEEPRYLTLLFPPLCLMIGWSFNRSFAVMVFGLIMTMPLTIVGLRAMNPPRASPAVEQELGHSDLAPVIQTLREHDARYVVADYWIAYPITFETREEIIATSSGFVRYQPHDSLVRSQPGPAYVFHTGTPEQVAFDADPATAGYAPLPAGRYTVYVAP